MNLIVNYFLLILVSYFVGAIPFSLIFSKILRGVDVRGTGSGNVGATNALISAGKRAAALAMFFDVAKSFAIVVAARLLVGSDIAVVLAALATIIGHDFSIYLNFEGGKGVASTVGAFIAINPYSIILVLGLYVFFLFLTQYLILSSLIVLLLMPIVFLLLGDGMPFASFGVIAFLLALFTHRGDISRFLAGQETRFSRTLNRMI